jgi:hypothetical protein
MAIPDPEPLVFGAAIAPVEAHAKKAGVSSFELALPRPSTLARWLSIVIVLLVAATTDGQVIRLRFGYTYAHGLIPLFYLDDEANVPTWYSSMTLLLAAALLLAIAVTVRGRADTWWRYWAGLAAVFVALSLDEVAQVHELLIEPLRGRVGSSGWLYYPWVLAGGLFALVVALAFARFLFALPPRTRALFVIAGAVYLSGTLGVETLTAHLDFEYGPADVAYVAAVTVEETLEMAGIVVFLYALLDHLHRMVDRAPSTVAAR